MPIVWAKMRILIAEKRLPIFLKAYSKVFPCPSPHNEKMKILEKYGNTAPWVETGTYMGDTTAHFANKGKMVFTIEPNNDFAYLAMQRFSTNSLVKVYHGSSEEVLGKVITELIGARNRKLNFWLDGHFSGGTTHKGEIDTPIRRELEVISEYLHQFDEITIFVDDLRCFNPSLKGYESYPRINFLIDWSKVRNMTIRFKKDICILEKKHDSLKAKVS